MVLTYGPQFIILIHHSGKDATRGARGWSGLRAAADAEIEVTRTGDFRAATITKMKDGSDGLRLPFKLQTLELGFDPDGEAESSCIVEHVEAAEDRSPDSRGAKPAGAYQTTMYDALKQLAAGGTVDQAALYAEVLERMPKGEGRDQRDKSCKRALESLCAKKLAYMLGDRVSLTPIVELGDSEWLE